MAEIVEKGRLLRRRLRLSGAWQIATADKEALERSLALRANKGDAELTPFVVEKCHAV